MIKTLLFSLLLSLARPAAAVPDFRVEGAPADAARMRAVLTELYPGLPAEVRAMYDAGLVSVLDRSPFAEELAAKGIGGWGPEDDPDYRYPDRTLYPRGTIKTTYTRVFLDLLALLERVAEPEARKTVLTVVGVVVVHEATHARQYMTRPVPHLRAEDRCTVLGDCDEAKLRGTREKIAYEEETFRIDFAYQSALKPDPRALHAYLEREPRVLEGLLPFTGMLAVSVAARADGEMRGAQRAFYHSSYESVELARRYHLAFGAVVDARASGDAGRLKAARHLLRDADARYDRLFSELDRTKTDPAAAYRHLEGLLPGLRLRRDLSAQSLSDAVPAHH